MSKTVVVPTRIDGGCYDIRCYNGDSVYMFTIYHEGRNWVARNRNTFPVVWDTTRKRVISEIELFDESGLTKLNNYEYTR